MSGARWRVRLPLVDGMPFSGAAPTRVRYAWADSPVVNTYDARELPLPGFEIAVGE